MIKRLFREQNVASGLIVLPTMLKRVRERFDARSMDVEWPGALSKVSRHLSRIDF